MTNASQRPPRNRRCRPGRRRCSGPRCCRRSALIARVWSPSLTSSTALSQSSELRHVERVLERLLGSAGEVVDQRDVTDHGHADLAGALIGEDATEQHQEHQREDDREEHRLPVAQEALEDRDRQRASAPCAAKWCAVMRGTPARSGSRRHPRASRPSPADPSSASRSREGGQHCCRVAGRQARPGPRRVSTLSTPGMRAASSQRRASTRSTLIRTPASRPRIRAAGVSSSQDLAVVHDRDPVAQRLGLVEVVRGEHHGATVGVDLRQQVPEVAARLRVERGGRLVEEHHLGVVDQGAGDRQPLQLAAGQLLGPGVGLVVEPDRAEPFVGRARRRRRTSEAKVWICSRAVSRSKNDDACSWTPIRDSRPFVARPRTLPEQRDRAAVGGAQTFDDLQRRGLAGTVGPEDAEELPGRDREAHPVDRAADPRTTSCSSTASMMSVTRHHPRRDRAPCRRQAGSQQD